MKTGHSFRNKSIMAANYGCGPLFACTCMYKMQRDVVRVGDWE